MLNTKRVHHWSLLKFLLVFYLDHLIWSLLALVTQSSNDFVIANRFELKNSTIRPLKEFFKSFITWWNPS